MGTNTTFPAAARRIAALLIIMAALVGIGYLALPHLTTAWLHRDIIIAADLWAPEPRMLSAGYGFDGIIGVSGGEAEVRAAGGTWNSIACINGAPPDRAALTSSAQPFQVALAYGRQVANADGLPVVFSWPLLPSTLDPSDFRVTLNTGETLVPQAASIFPNVEYNERHVAVVFGDFGNRLLPGEPGARFVTRVEVVADATPLQLIGPHGPVSAVGLFKDSTTSPYQSGPYLVGAKLNRLSATGEGAPAFLAANLPNDGVALYGVADAYRLRVFTSGGFSPDGVRALLPSEFARFFRLHAETASGQTLLITQTNQEYRIDGGTIQVLGLAELGLPQSQVAYDDCYREDHDNYKHSAGRSAGHPADYICRDPGGGRLCRVLQPWWAGQPPAAGRALHGARPARSGAGDHGAGRPAGCFIWRVSCSLCRAFHDPAICGTIA